MLSLEFDQGANKGGFDDLLPVSTASKLDAIKEISVEISAHHTLCQEIQTVSSRLDTKLDVLSLHELLVQTLQLISISQKAAVLQDLEHSLDQMHGKVNLWRLSTYFEPEEIRLWENFLAVYLKFPERFVAVFERSTARISNPKLFFCKIFEDLIAVDSNLLGEASSKILNKVFLSGFQDEFFSKLVKNDLSGRYWQRLTILTMASKIPGVYCQVLNQADIVLYDDHHLANWIAMAMLPAVQSNSDLLPAVVDEILRYRNVFRRALVLFLSACFWMLPSPDCMAMLLKAIQVKKPCQLTASILIACLAFVSGRDLSHDHDLAHQMTKLISELLYHAEPLRRTEGMIIAEMFGHLYPTDRPLYFDLDEESEQVRQYRGVLNLVRDAYSHLHPLQETVLYKFQRPILIAQTCPGPMEEHCLIETIPSSPAQTGPSDASLRTFLPPLILAEPKNAKIRRPKCLQHCLEYLRSEDPDKWELALEDLPAILGNSFVLETKEFGPQLFKTLLYLSDQYKLKNFEAKRKESLGAILNRVPDTCLRMLKMEFAGKSLNLGQKSDILDVILVELKALITRKNMTMKCDDVLKSLALDDDFNVKPLQSPLSMPVLIQHFFLPLISSLQSSRSNMFLTAHDFLLEKLILTLSLFFYGAANALEFPAMIGPLLNFLKPVLCESGYSTPVNVAAMQALSALFTTWPEHLDVIPHLEDLGRISNWVVVQSQTWEDPVHCMIAAKTLTGLKALTDTKRILSEYSQRKSLDISVAGLKL